MKLAYNPTWRVLNVVAIVMSVLQTATLVDADAIKCVAGVWCCEQYVREECEGLAQDRLNYTIECVSPNVVNVKWEVTQRKFTDDVYTVTAQYSCYNTASGEKSTWMLSDHTSNLSDNIVLYDFSMGDDVYCTFTACTFGAKNGRHRCYDYIHEDDEVTIDSTCFATGVSNVLSSEEASSVVPTSTSLLQPSEISLLVTTRDLEGEISSVSSEPPFASPISAQNDDKNSVLSDAVVVVLCIGFIFVGLASLVTCVLGCCGRKKKAKVSDTLFDGGIIYKPKPPTENILADDLRYVSISGSLLTLLEPLQFFNIDRREKALMIHMESSGGGFTHIGEDNDDPDGKCANDNVSLTTVRLDDAQSLKDMCTCPHPNSECLSECSSINTPVLNQHHINAQATKTRYVQESASSKNVRNTRHLSSVTSGYMSTGYVSDSDSSRLPSFRNGFTLSVSTDGYVGDMNLEPGLLETRDASFREDSIEPSFISHNDDYVFDSSISVTCGPPAHPSPGVPPFAGCCDVEENSKPVHFLSLGANEYIQDSHSHQLHCSSPTSISADDQDCCSRSPMASNGYIHGFPCDAHLDNSGVRELDPAHSPPSASLSLLPQDKNSNDSSCSLDIPSSAIHKLVPIDTQPSASPSVAAIDGYVLDSSCVPPLPTGPVHRQSQPSTFPSILASDGYIGSSPLSHQLHHSPPISTSPAGRNCAPVSLTVSDGYIHELPCDSPLEEFVPTHKQPAPSATVPCAANSNNSPCIPSLPSTTTHHLVPAHNQPSASSSVPTLDGYIHDSTYTPPPPTGTPHGHSQLSTPSSALSNQPSTPAVDGYIHDSSCIPQPPAYTAHRHSKSSALPSALASDGYICDSLHCPSTSIYATCGIDSARNELLTPQSSFESDGYVYDPSHTSPTSVNAASGLCTVHSQPSADSPTSGSDGYIHDQGHVGPPELLPSSENKGYVLASSSRQPFATLPTTTSGYTCDLYSTPSCSGASGSKSKGEVSGSAEHPCLHFPSDRNTTTSLVDTNRLQPLAGCSQLPATTDGVMRNMRLQISIDIPAQGLPLSSDYVTESSLPPRVGYSSTRRYSTPASLQRQTSDYLDEDSLRNMDSVYRHEPKYTHQAVPNIFTCLDPTMDLLHESRAHETMLSKQAHNLDSSSKVFQVDGDGYIATPLHS